jgi:hypothetical protein
MCPRQQLFKKKRQNPRISRKKIYSYYDSNLDNQFNHRDVFPLLKLDVLNFGRSARTLRRHPHAGVLHFGPSFSEKSVERVHIRVPPVGDHDLDHHQHRVPVSLVHVHHPESHPDQY